jgi:hypothetical protein
MDNSNNLSNSILETIKPSTPVSIVSTNPTSSSDTSFFDYLKNISFTTWLLIILILAFLGFNIFVYLAKGTQDFTSFLGPFLQKIFGITLSVTGETVDVAAEGAKSAVTTTADVVNAGLTTVQNISPNPSQSSIKTEPITETKQQPDNASNNSLNKALNTSQQSQIKDRESDYEAHEASSSVHLAGKSGWCYIGEDRGFRSCAQVGVNDHCMSGDIFPTQELCINPNLRV